jgi:hypothetical protein
MRKSVSPLTMSANPLNDEFALSKAGITREAVNDTFENDICPTASICHWPAVGLVNERVSVVPSRRELPVRPVGLTTDKSTSPEPPLVVICSTGVFRGTVITA